jgi:hypothetical protein
LTRASSFPISARNSAFLPSNATQALSASDGCFLQAGAA